MKRLNQILSVDNNRTGNVKKNRTKNSGPVEIQNILKFFSIVIIIFGVFMIGSGSYSMYKDVNKEEVNSKPVIYVEQTSETEILLKVTHDKELSKITYEWNDERATEIPFYSKK